MILTLVVLTAGVGDLVAQEPDGTENSDGGDSVSEPPRIELWPEGAPGALGEDPERDRPYIEVYLTGLEGSEKRSAMVICPGGGYGHLARHEGHDYALFLNRHGMQAFVLHYRLGNHGYRHPAMLNDVARAIRVVRHRSEEWGVDPERVGVMGSSAGGHLASTILTHWDRGLSEEEAGDSIDRESSRPDFGVLCYPVVTMRDSHTHGGSRRNLLGETPEEELIELLSNEEQVTGEAPPVFLWHTAEDRAVPVQNSLGFAMALADHGVAHEVHVYERGAHGLGLVAKPPGFEDPHPWAMELVRWLGENDWLAAELEPDSTD